jgi:hypothetical protein
MSGWFLPREETEFVVLVNGVELFLLIDHPTACGSCPSSCEEGIKGWWLECKEFLPSDPDYDIFTVRIIPNQP